MTKRATEKKKVTLRTLGEFGLLKRLRAKAPPLPLHVLLGIGDDASIVQPSPGSVVLATVDVLVEGKDFRWEWCPPEAVGHKGLVVSLSDVGAMGAIPRYALVALGLPPRMPLHRVDDLYRGLWKTTLIGEGEVDRLVRRSGGKPGDTIWVTGPLGRAAAGLRALKAGYRLLQSSVKGTRGRKVSSRTRKALRETMQAQLYPVARFREGKVLADARLATAMIDLSDGLASDLTRLSEESGVGARIVVDRIPVDSLTKQVAQLLRFNPLRLALYGGEDFELLFTSGADAATVRETLTSRGFTRPYAIGELLPAEEGLFLVGPRGRRAPLQGGYEHFR
jgi:thiamine-monophosphate kinase